MPQKLYFRESWIWRRARNQGVPFRDAAPEPWMLADLDEPGEGPRPGSCQSFQLGMQPSRAAGGHVNQCSQQSLSTFKVAVTEDGSCSWGTSGRAWMSLAPATWTGIFIEGSQMPMWILLEACLNRLLGLASLRVCLGYLSIAVIRQGLIWGLWFQSP